MAVSVLVTSVALEPPLFVTSDRAVVTIGRARGSIVQLPDDTVSAKHAVLRRRGSHYLVEDVGSTNGTAMLGRGDAPPVWLEPLSPRVVEDGQRLLLGGVELTLRLDGARGVPSEDLARDLVAYGLTLLEQEPSSDSVDAALAELIAAPDRALPNRVKTPASPSRAPSPLDHQKEVDATDLALFALVGICLLAALAGLYWLLVY